MTLNSASYKKLDGVKPDLVKVVKRAAELTRQPFQVVQGNRTQAEQDAIYAQGRTKPGPIVTWTRKSKHIGGNAIDFAALVNGAINWNSTFYPSIALAFKRAAIELGIGIEWGGDWKTKDWGHVQLTGVKTVPVEPKPQSSLSVVRATIKQGATGGDVFVLQRLLGGLTVDGDFGPKTHAAVKAFQESKGLAVTGIVDPLTWSALEPKLASVTPETLLESSVVADVLGNSVEPSKKSNPELAMDFFQQRGWEKHQAAAIVGHAQQESYKDLRPGAVGDAGKSHGIFQWNGARYAALNAFAARTGMDIAEIETQLAFVEYELSTTEKRTAALLKASRTVEEAVRAFMGYERPTGFSWEHPEKGHGYANRLHNARALL